VDEKWASISAVADQILIALYCIDERCGPPGDDSLF